MELIRHIHTSKVNITLANPAIFQVILRLTDLKFVHSWHGNTQNLMNLDFLCYQATSLSLLSGTESRSTQLQSWTLLIQLMKVLRISCSFGSGVFVVEKTLKTVQQRVPFSFCFLWQLSKNSRKKLEEGMSLYTTGRFADEPYWFDSGKQLFQDPSKFREQKYKSKPRWCVF